MKLTALLTELSQLGANLFIEGEQLRIRAPRGALTAEHRELLGKYKADLVQLLQEREAQPTVGHLPLLPVSRQAPLLLSLEQERLWMVNQIFGSQSTHNLVQAIRLQGKLEVEKLEKSLNIIVQRHESLRTTFVLVDGQPIQKINSQTVNLTTELVADFIDVVEQESQHIFDLEKGPLWHFRLFYLEENDYVLLITFHHLIGDIFSANVLLQEVIAFYQNPDVTWPPLPIQYADFAASQRQWLSSGKLEAELDYWRKNLNGTPTSLNLPTDSPRPTAPSCSGRHHTFQLDNHLWTNLKQWSQEQGITPTTTLLTAFQILLHLISRQEDIIIGFPTSGRSHPQLEPAIGFFAYPLPLRANLSGNPTLSELLGRVRQTMKETYSHQFVPFSKVAEAVQKQSNRPHSPIFQVLFSTFLGKQLDSVSLRDLTFALLPEASRSPADIDLLWSLYECDGNLYGVLGYSADLFDEATIAELVESYSQVLNQCFQKTDNRLSEFQLTDALRHKVQVYHGRAEKPLLAIAATFTAEPLRDTLQFWLTEISLNYQIEFAPYNQIFQQLLDDNSLISQNCTGVNIILLRFEDWLRFSPDDPPLSTLERNITDLLQSLQAAVHRHTTPYIVALCPCSSETLAEQWQHLEEKLLRDLADLPGVYPLNSREMLTFYPVTNYYDAQGDQLGHIPYSAIFYTGLGTLLVRKLHRLKQSPYKVIVLDCDNTLWQGVCGEDGVEGIALTPPYQSLQASMVRQAESGMLLCLCSKNTESDVRQVFAERSSDMILSWEHLVAWRINWQPKSDNLRALAQDLQLGLDSFIFIDDNPLEIAEVQASCPEVLSLCLPANPLDIPSFLKQVWAFDNLKITAEDRKRLAFYQENVQRQQVLNSSLTLGDFISGLNLQVQINPITERQIPRVAQLTQRTNQFNATTIRRSEIEIQSLWQSGQLNCLVVEVSDRFGDYGLVGVILYSLTEAALKVDSFLLSCRTLGRGVEHQMLAKLGQIAKESGLDWVEVNYYPTPKNQPILHFLESINPALSEQTSKETRFRFSVEVAAEVVYQSDRQTISPSPSPKVTSSAGGRRWSGEQVQRIATQLSEPQQIWQEIQTQLTISKQQDKPRTYVPPQTEIEKQLAKIWSELLHLETVGTSDNFFELGGDSILIIQLVAQAHRLGLQFTPIQVFEHPTIAQLAPLVSTSYLRGSGQGLMIGSVPLTPIQHWFFAQNSPNPHHFNQSFLLEVDPLEPQKLEQALAALVGHHDALRLRFTIEEGQWQQHYSESVPTIPLLIYDLSDLSPQEQKQSLESQANQLQASLNLHQGPLMAVALFSMGSNRTHRLLIIVHHLVIDGISWRILLEDLVSAYQQLASGATVQLPPKTDSLQRWAQQLEEYARSATLLAEVDYWLSYAHFPIVPLPSDIPYRIADNTVGNSSRLEVSLDEESTRALLQDVPGVYNTQINDVLLTALAYAFSQWTNQNHLVVDLEGHGREDIFSQINVSRTIGWFTTLFPVVLEWKEQGWGNALKSIKEQLRAIPKRGIGYGVVRYLSSKHNLSDKLKELHPAQVSFNYLGQFEQILALFPLLGIDLLTSRGEECSPLSQRPYLIDVIGYKLEQKLQFIWIYNPKIHSEITIKRVGEWMLEGLIALIEHCQCESAGGYTPSDFPDADLSQAELDLLLAAIEEEK